MNEQKSAVRIGLIFLAVVILVFAFYFLYPQFSKNTEVPHDLGDQFVQNDISKEVVVNNSNEITFASTKIIFKEPWIVKTGQLGVTNTSFWCEGDSTLCFVYSITDGINEFYVGNYKIGKNITTTVIPTEENLDGVPWTNTFRIYRLKLENNDPNASISNLNAGYEGSSEEYIADPNNGPIVQIVGCLKDNVCVSSGVLSQDPDEHLNTYNSFINFLNSIEIH